MHRKTLSYVLGFALLLVLLAVSTPISLAGPPAARPDAAPRLSAPNVPADGPFSQTKAPHGKVDRATAQAKVDADLAALQKQLANSSVKLTMPDNKNLPDSVRAAVALKNSLSKAQRKQLRAILNQSSGELKAITDAGLAAGKPTAPASGKNPVNVTEQAAKLSNLAARMEKEVAKVLTPAQLVNHLAATHPTFSTLASSGPRAIKTAMVGAPTQDSDCYYGGYYELLAQYYMYYGYLYAYYNYETYGGDYAYYGYLYSYYGYYYSQPAGEELSAAYFEYLTIGSDWQSYGYNGQSDAYDAYIYALYGYYYNYDSYYYEGGYDYAYYAEYLEYYGQYYGYYGYYYGYYDCQ